MRFDRNAVYFVPHSDWYQFVPHVGFVPTDKAPEDAVKAMREYNSYTYHSELDNHSILTEQLPDNAPRYDFKEIREYCKENSKTLAEMRQEEIDQFISEFHGIE